MRKMKEDELLNTVGGGYGLGFIIGAIVVVVAGIVDGFTRPLKCNK